MFNNGNNDRRGNIEQADGEVTRNPHLAVPAAAPSRKSYHQQQNEDISEGSSRSQNSSITKGQPNHITNTVDLLRSFDVRLETFPKKWPESSSIPMFDIAKAGMQYIGPDDKVQCEYCRGILYSWDDGDVPLEEHQKHFSQCPFLQERCWEILEKEIEQNNKYSRAAVNDNKNKEFPNEPMGYVHCEQIKSPEMINQKSGFEQSNPATICEDSMTKDDSKSTVVVNIVKSMGYNEEMIQKAIKVLQKDASKPEINSSNLLDILFQLEDSMDSDDEIDTLDKQMRTQVTIN